MLVISSMNEQNKHELINIISEKNPNNLSKSGISDKLQYTVTFLFCGRISTLCQKLRCENILFDCFINIYITIYTRYGNSFFYNIYLRWFRQNYSVIIIWYNCYMPSLTKQNLNGGSIKMLTISIERCHVYVLYIGWTAK